MFNTKADSQQNPQWQSVMPEAALIFHRRAVSAACGILAGLTAKLVTLQGTMLQNELLMLPQHPDVVPKQHMDNTTG